jgi:hypothetical protein
VHTEGGAGIASMGVLKFRAEDLRQRVPYHPQRSDALNSWRSTELSDRNAELRPSGPLPRQSPGGAL